MGAFKKISGRKVFFDFSEIKIPSFKQMELRKEAAKKNREIRKIDPFARLDACGRKRIYRSAEDLKKACDEYFKKQECIIYDKWGQPVIDPATKHYVKSTKPLTISGLGLHLGISTHTLRSYRAISKANMVDPDFARVILDALQRIEAYAEGRSYDKNGSGGAKFVLERGFGWNSRKELAEAAEKRSNVEIAMRKLKMQEEKHRLEMQILRSGLEGKADKDISITIKRADSDD